MYKSQIYNSYRERIMYHRFIDKYSTSYLPDIIWLAGAKHLTTMKSVVQQDLSCSRKRKQADASCRKVAETFQNPLIKEYTLLHIRDPSIV